MSMGTLRIDLSVLITVCFASVTRGFLNITIPVRLNSDAMLPCRLPPNSPPNLSVRWFTKSEGWLTVGTNVYKHRKQISVNKPAPNEWNLSIRKVAHSFADIYTCETNHGVTGEIMSIINLVIETSPRIDESQSSSKSEEFQEFSTATLTCAVSGTPEPEVTWYRGSSETEIGITGSELKMRNITRYASNEYLCRAKNKNGEAERRISVTVNFEPDVTVMEPVVYAAGGEVVVMLCRIQASPLHGAYWTRGSNDEDKGSPIKPNWKYLVMEDGVDGMAVRFITLVIRKSILTSHDYGIYTCVARGETSVAQASVKLQAKVVTEEDDEKVIKYD